MNDMQPLIDLMSGKFGWFATLLAWIGALRLPAKLLQGWLQRLGTALVARVLASPEPDDDALLRRCLESLTYRVIALFADVLLSIKLPTAASLEAHRAAQPAIGERAESGEGTLRLLSWLVGLLALAGLNGCGSLDPAGVYHSDRILYEAESNIAVSYQVIQSFVAWEKENRAALAAWPEIRGAADVMRAQAPRWFQTAHAWRDAYAANASAENQTALASALAVLHAGVAEAAGYMAARGSVGSGH